MMLLKGRTNRAQVCPVVAINFKELLVLVEGWRGWEEIGHLSFCSDFLLGVLHGPPITSPHTLALLIRSPADSCFCCFPLRIPAFHQRCLCLMACRSQMRSFIKHVQWRVTMKEPILPVSPVSALLFFTLSRTGISIQSVTWLKCVGVSNAWVKLLV